MRKTVETKRILFFAAILALLLFSWHATFAMPVDDVPNPRTKAGLFVEDSGSVLGPEYVSLIDNVSKLLEASTGAELAVVTVDNLEGTTVEDYAEKLFKRFGIGKKGKDNGLLILFSRDDRRIRIEVGYGLEGAINDAKAGRILDENAIPLLKQNQFARGIFAAAKALAGTVASSEGATLSVADPATWPVQVEIPKPKEAETKQKPKIDSLMASLYYLLAAAIFSILAFGFLHARVRLAKAKAQKEKILEGGNGLLAAAWFGGFVVIFIIGSYAGNIVLPIIVFIVSSILITLANISIRNKMKKKVVFYKYECPDCKKPMELISEESDDAFLTKEEIAEEEAGGINYEFWKCPSCERLEKFIVKLDKADKCPNYNRRTLTQETTVLKAATTSSSGRKKIDYICKNPGCGYTRTEEKNIPRVSSGRSSSGSSSGGSFGGGSSGGGGASRGF